MTIEGLIPEPADRILCVKVGKVQRENLYEMTRKYWKVNLVKASCVTHVCAVIDGVVEAVFIPLEWKYSSDKGYEERSEFMGKEDPQSKYIGKSVVGYYGKSQNPVKNTAELSPCVQELDKMPDVYENSVLREIMIEDIDSLNDVVEEVEMALDNLRAILHNNK